MPLKVSYLFFVILSVSLSKVARYRFGYAIYDPNTRDIKQQHEEMLDGVVRGFYTLLEADGSKRIVEYTAGPRSGFKAVIKRIELSKEDESNDVIDMIKCISG